MLKEYSKITLDKNKHILDYECNFIRSAYRPKDLLGKNWINIFIEDKNKKEVNECIESLTAFTTDIHCKSGSFKLVNFKLSTQTDKETILYGTESIFTDDDTKFHFVGKYSLKE